MIGLSEVPAYVQGPALLAILAGLGLAVGVMTGLFGVGGGFMVVPLLNVLLGIPYPLAVGSSLSFIIGTSAGGVARHARMGNVDVKTVLILSAASMAGAFLGAMLLEALRAALNGGNEHTFTLVMHGLFIMLLVLTAWLLMREPARRSVSPLLQRLPLPPRVDLEGVGVLGLSLPGLVVTGTLIGVLTGLMGIGGGVVLVPLLLLAVGLTMHQAVGTSLGVVLFASIAGTLKHGMQGNGNLWIALALLAGSAVGVQLGAMLAGRLEAKRLKRYFAILVLIVAAALILDGLHMALSAASR